MAMWSDSKKGSPHGKAHADKQLGIEDVALIGLSFSHFFAYTLVNIANETDAASTITIG